MTADTARKSDKMPIEINNILCFIQSARDTDTRNEILGSVENFYKSKDIQKSKNVIFDAIQVKPVSRREVSKDIDDILEAFDKAESQNLSLPIYAAVGRNALPPANGYEFLKDILDNVKEELVKLKSEIATLKSQKPEGIQQEIKNSMADMKRKLNLEFLTQFEEFKKEFRNSVNVTPGYVQQNAGQKNMQIEREYALKYRDSTPMEKKQYANAVKKVADSKATPSEKASSNVAQTQNRTGKPKPKFKHDVIRGNKKVDGKLLGAVRYASMYVGGCNKDIVSDDIKNYCINNLKVDIQNVEPLLTKSTRFNSFKVTLTYEDRKEILFPDCWPENVVVRKYTQPRGNSSNQLSSNLNNDVGAVISQYKTKD